ncbi:MULTISPECIES: hypothetical protein [Enterobacteriaceae]|uniref:hypothetical protein n=1 Tax=Enterobacteriaceae TaxID=543 RepID=UPI001CA43B38|nr:MULTISPECIES: hypothetical protein [Enterobacteriaceae]WPO96911.1 hypothetical protein SFA32_08190 [Buttiauxella sp. HR94]
MIKAAAFISVGFLLGINAFASTNDDQWMPFPSNTKNNEKASYFIKKGSYAHRDGKSSLLMQQIEVNAAKKKIVSYYKLEISDEVCDEGYGKIYGYFLDGKHAFDGDYVSGGQSGGSFLGELLCTGKREYLTTMKPD